MTNVGVTNDEKVCNSVLRVAHNPSTSICEQPSARLQKKKLQKINHAQCDQAH